MILRKIVYYLKLKKKRINYIKKLKHIVLFNRYNEFYYFEIEINKDNIVFNILLFLKLLMYIFYKYIYFIILVIIC